VTGIVVPLIFRSRGLGSMLALDRLSGGPDFSEADLEMITTFAGSAAIVVGSSQAVNARTLKLAMDSAEHERTRWARSLHHGVLSELDAVAQLLKQLADEPVAVSPRLAQAIDGIDASVDAIRSLIADLRPFGLEELGVGPAVDALVVRTRALSGLEIELDVALGEDGSAASRPPAAVAETAYRVIQESLANVVKHARAGRVEVRLLQRDGVQISVRDDGIGFDAAAEDRGFGLLGLQERVELLGGSFQLVSSDGAGTTVSVRLPSGAG
jgi:signal transduction histidine kinase